MFALSGCFLQSIVGWVGDDGRASLSANVEIGFCDPESSIPEFRGCTYFIEDDGFLFEITSTFQLVTEFGLFGVLIDPLILQVPDDVSGVVATYNNAGSDEGLVVTETDSFLVTPTTTVTAETGTKFLILELPDAVAAALPPGRSDFNFSLDFDTDDALNLFVKSMLTASYDEGGQRYYLPMFPCVTDFSAIPATRVPVSTGFEFLNPTFAPLYNNGAAFACDQVVYDFANVSPVLCGGLVVTIDMNTNGGVGTGTAGADVILGTPLADTIDGAGGDDTICADRGDDTVYGGPGDDRIFGGQGADTIRGADGNDTIHGNRGDDVLFGGAGNDRIFGYAHNDTIAGGPGNDRLHGNFGDDIITGDGGNDRIFGYGDSDNLDGGPGDDLISGNFGDDVLNGGDGDDELYGADGDDEVNGGEGNDRVNGNSLNDVLQGGGGDDVLDGGIDTDSCDGGTGIDTATRCETVTGVP